MSRKVTRVTPFQRRVVVGSLIADRRGRVMAGRSGDGVELNVFVLRRALHDSIEAEESLEQGKLEFRDAKSGSVSSWAKRREGRGSMDEVG